MRLAAYFLPRLPLLVVAGYAALVSGYAGMVGALSLFILCPLRLRVLRPQQFMAATIATLLVVGWTILFPANANFLGEKAHGIAPVILGVLVLGGIWVNVEKPWGGPQAALSFSFVGAILVGMPLPHDGYPYFAAGYVVVSILSLRGLDPGKKPLKTMQVRHGLVRLGMGALAAAFAGGAIVGLPPLYDWSTGYAAEVLDLGGGYKSGFSRVITLGRVRDIILSNELIFRIHGGPVDHLRGAVYRHYRSGFWAESLEVVKRETTLDEPTPSLLEGRVRIERVGSEEARLFVPLSAGLLAADGGTAQVDALGVFYPGHSGTWEEIEIGGTDRSDAVMPPDEEDRVMPEDLRVPIEALAVSWTKGATTAKNRLDRIVRRLHEDYDYALAREATRGVDPVLDFLTTNRAGHCELFASAMTLLSRSLGIPARVIGGFRVTERHPWMSHWVVRGRNAHSWVEAYVDGRWMTFDPTPPGSLTDQMPTRSNGWSAALEAVRYAIRRGVTFVAERSGAELLAFSFVVVLWLFRREIGALIRRRRREAESMLGEFSGPLSCFEPLEAGLSACPRRPGETIEAWADRIEDEPSFGAKPAALLRAYAALRYGGVGKEAELRASIYAWRNEEDRAPSPR